MNTNAAPTETVLVIVAHTDDEALGLGGTIARHVDNGDKVYAIAMTDGVTSRSDHGDTHVEHRLRVAREAAALLGFTWLEGGNFPDNAMDGIPLLNVVRIIEAAKALVKPTCIYTHSSADLNIDHRIVCQATLVAFRPQPGEIWREIRAFEVPSATDYGHGSVTATFAPNLYVDITATWEKKRGALKAYSVEMRAAPHSRSLEGVETLAMYRGSQVGLWKAEAFEVVRKVLR